MEQLDSMVAKPFFSVIVPIYNKGPHIARSLGSVLKQSFDNFELILVCDPSTDNSNDEVAKLSDHRISIYHRNEPGPGGYAARNLGISVARSDWIAFLDADDEWHEDHLERLHELHEMFPNAGVLSAGWLTSNAGEMAPDSFTRLARKERVFLTLREYLLSELSSNRPICTSTACIQRNILLSSEGFPENKIRMGGDVDTWLRCIYEAKGIARINKCGAIYHRDAVNMVTKSSYMSPEVHNITTRRLLKRIQDDEVGVLLRKRYNYMVLRAWFNNLHCSEGHNFNLCNTLDFGVDRIRMIAYAVIGSLPKVLVVFLHRGFRIVKGCGNKFFQKT